ncbi:unnamed protein product [Ectocarpus sp. 12 AP-2014]
MQPGILRVLFRVEKAGAHDFGGLGNLYFAIGLLFP